MSFGKISLRIHPLFWCVAFLIGWLWAGTLALSFVSAGLVFLSVLLHELGHAWTAVLCGQQAEIRLTVFGGLTKREGGALKLWQQFFVVLNGPLMSALLAFSAYVALFYPPFTYPLLLVFSLKFMYVANFFWTLLNLIPVLPLDGGYLLSILLESLFGFRGTKVTVVIGVVVSIAVSIFFFIAGLFFVGSLFLILMFENFRSLRYYKIFNEKDREPRLQAWLQQADEEVACGCHNKAISTLEKIRGEAQEGILYTMASVHLAEIYHEAGKIEHAYSLIHPLLRYLNGEQLALFQKLAYGMHEYTQVTQEASRCYQEAPSYQVAFINALAFGALEQLEPALGWLECAIREGLPHPEIRCASPEFDAIRMQPLFQQLLATLQQSHKS